jgi:guanylate kinase
MFVLSSPSGAGKSTLSRRLLEHDPAMSLSVSMTTRAARPGEQDGREYHFVTREAFEKAIDRGDLLEWASVFDHLYGTPRGPVEAALAAGRDVLFDVDWQGARALRVAAAPDVVGVFILPPDMTELERRLHARAQDDAGVIARRMAKSADEIKHWDEYDYVLVNHDLDETERHLKEILSAERQKRARQSWLAPFVEGLLGQKR